MGKLGVHYIPFELEIGIQRSDPQRSRFQRSEEIFAVIRTNKNKLITWSHSLRPSCLNVRNLRLSCQDAVCVRPSCLNVLIVRSPCINMLSLRPSCLKCCKSVGTALSKFYKCQEYSRREDQCHQQQSETSGGGAVGRSV